MALCLILQPSQHSDGHQHIPVALTNNLLVLSLPLLRSQPIWWSQPKHVAITPLCWSSAYPCWNHSQTYGHKLTTVSFTASLVILSLSLLRSQPTWMLSAYPCSHHSSLMVTSLSLLQLQPFLVVLNLILQFSLPLWPFETTCWSSVFPLTNHTTQMVHSLSL